MAAAQTRSCQQTTSRKRCRLRLRHNRKRKLSDALKRVEPVPQNRNTPSRRPMQRATTDPRRWPKPNPMVRSNLMCSHLSEGFLLDQKMTAAVMKNYIKIKLVLRSCNPDNGSQPTGHAAPAAGRSAISAASKQHLAEGFLFCVNELTDAIMRNNIKDQTQACELVLRGCGPDTGLQTTPQPVLPCLVVQSLPKTR